MAASSTAAFGDLLRRFRLAAGLTQEELAERARLSPNAISDLERGARKRPWRETILLLADALQLAPSERSQLEAAARPRAAPVLAQPTPEASAESPGNLPTPPNSLLGRERELAALEERLLRRDVRLLTLTGPGGIGKTRLALELATNVRETFADGVFLVRLAPIRDPDLVISAIARVLEIDEVPERPLLDTVKDRLRRRRTLLVRDNFEHVLPAAPIVAELLATCPALKILATSRAALRLRGEREFGVQPLSVPDGRTAESGRSDDVAALGKFAAVRLFVERAQEVDGSFDLSDENARAVGDVCYRLEGLPLAIELAAARIRVLSPRALLPLLDRRLTVLTGGAADLPDRQRTLRDTLAWSYDLLNESERLAFRRLAIFVGGCSLDAAKAILEADLPSANQPSRSADDSLDRLDALLGKSLVRRFDQPDGESRFGMLETIREFGLERLAACGEEDAVRRWHARYFAALAGEADARLETSDQGDWNKRLDAELANTRAALAWCVERDSELGLVLAASLGAYWETRGHVLEGQRWLQAILSTATAKTPARARALAEYAYLLGKAGGAAPYLEEALAIYRGEGDARGMARSLADLAWVHQTGEDYDAARTLLAEAIPLARESGDAEVLARSLLTLSINELHRGDIDRAWRLCEDSLTLRRRFASPLKLAWSIGMLGNLARVRGDRARSRELFEEGLRLVRDTGGSVSGQAGWFLASLGYLARVDGDFSRARSLLRESYAVLVKLGDRFMLAGHILYLGIMAIEEGAVEQGTRLIASYESISPNTQGGLEPDEKADRDNCLARARASLGDAAYERAWAEGQAMTLEQAVAAAMEE